LNRILPVARVALLFAMTGWASAALAGPARCSYGNQDSTCTTPISRAPIPQPQCPTGLGWTTVSASAWQGSQWSAPQCNYQAPPTCPAGYDLTSPPVWNGASWVGLGCSPDAPQPPSNPPALFVGYCGTVWYVRPGPTDWSCTYSLAGGKYIASSTGSDNHGVGAQTYYWSTPQSFIVGYDGGSNDMNATAPAGMVLYWVNDQWTYGAAIVWPRDSDVAATHGNGGEVFWYACPASAPHLVASTLNQLHSNPLQVTCGP
jgi:hypothetical protein